MTNLRSTRARQRCGDAMRAHDRLPADLRHWAMQAALPWSARSLKRLWDRSLRQTGCRLAAIDRLNKAEAAALAREAAEIWGRVNVRAASP